MWRHRPFASARARILASYLILLTFSTVVGTLALREVLLARAGERVDDALVQEVEEFRTLARIGRDPRTGDPFGNDIRVIFDVFLARNVPGEREAFFTYAGGEPYKESYDPRLRGVRVPAIDALASTTSSERGEVELDDGRRVRFIAVPVTGDRGARGVFAVAIDLSGEIGEVNDALRIAAGVSIGVLLLASLLAWVVAGRVLAPLRVLRDTARSIGESDLTRRITVEGDDELADLARTFNEMLDRLEEAFASQKAFISGRGPRAPHADHDHPRPPRRDGRRPERPPRDASAGERRARPHEPARERPAAARQGQSPRLSPTGDDRPRRSHARAVRQGLGPRQPRLAASGGRLRADRRRPPAPDPGAHEPEPERRGPHPSGRRGRARIRRSQRGRPAVGEGHRAGGAGARADAHLRTLRAPRPERRRGRRAGLAITRAVAESHGGRVELDSSPGQGARFTVIIPTEPPQEVSGR